MKEWKRKNEILESEVEEKRGSRMKRDIERETEGRREGVRGKDGGRE